MRGEVLVAESNPETRAMLAELLLKEGFAVRVAATGPEALAAVRAHLPATVVLDVGLPELNGFEVCVTLRAEAATAGARVLLLSRRPDEVDRLVGLSVGADDYVVRPCSLRELVLRVRSLMRRSATRAREGLVIDLRARRVQVDGIEVDLTRKEYALLAALVAGSGAVRTREELLAEVWGLTAETPSRTLDTHIRRLRSKLGSARGQLVAVRGLGYRLRAGWAGSEGRSRGRSEEP